MHPFIHIGSLSLPMYGLCTMVGTVFALLAVFKLRKKGSPLSEDNLLDALIWAILLGFLCAKLLYFIVDPPQMPHSWAELWDLISAGLVFYGGLLGGLLGLFLVSRKTKKNMITYTDLMAPCFCLAHAGGRVGCLMAGCCYGMEYTGPCAVVLDGVSRLPTQIMEAVFLVILAGVLIAVYLKKPRRGMVTGLYMTIYAVWRFVIEFFRADYRGNVGPLSTSQFISLFILAFGVYLLVKSRQAVNDFRARTRTRTGIRAGAGAGGSTRDGAPARGPHGAGGQEEGEGGRAFADPAGDRHPVGRAPGGGGRGHGADRGRTGGERSQRPCRGRRRRRPGDGGDQ